MEKPRERDQNIVAATYPEMKLALTSEVMRLAGPKMKMKGWTRKAEQAYVVNWILRWYFSRPREERDRVVEEGKRLFDPHILREIDVVLGDGASDKSDRHPRPLGNMTDNPELVKPRKRKAVRPN